MAAISVTLLFVAAAFKLRFADVMPSLPPTKTRRQCYVHKCDLTEADKKRERQNRCPPRRGHMQRMGMQQEMVEAPRVRIPSSRDFYMNYIAAAQPVILANAAKVATRGVEWTDEFLTKMCWNDRFDQPWDVIVEENKVIKSNTRWPYGSGSFCDFIKRYQLPQYRDSMYVINPLTEAGTRLGRQVDIPSVLRCSEVHEAIVDTRLWMSSGNTSSSLHFDTHENLMLQVVGSKTIAMWPPSESASLYMDFHDRFGLSPVHPERVDLEHYPHFAHAKLGVIARLNAGDALLIPDGWWHHVHTEDGKNAAVTWEFEPFDQHEQLWPQGDAYFQQWMKFKSSKATAVKYASKRFVTMRGGNIACNTSVPVDVTANTFRCGENHFDPHDRQYCNFRCTPQSCIMQQLHRKEYGRLDRGAQI